jgi:hypothetical protein
MDNAMFDVALENNKNNQLPGGQMQAIEPALDQKGGRSDALRQALSTDWFWKSTFDCRLPICRECRTMRCTRANEGLIG